MNNKILISILSVSVLAACGGPKTSADACSDWKKVGLRLEEVIDSLNRYSDKEIADEFDVATKKAYDISDYATDRTKLIFETAGESFGRARDLMLRDLGDRFGSQDYFDGENQVRKLNNYCDLDK